MLPFAYSYSLLYVNVVPCFQKKVSEVVKLKGVPCVIAIGAPLISYPVLTVIVTV